MIFATKKNGVVRWPPEDRVISIFAGCLANHDRAHSPEQKKSWCWRDSAYCQSGGTQSVARSGPECGLLGITSRRTREWMRQYNAQVRLDKQSAHSTQADSAASGRTWGFMFWTLLEQEMVAVDIINSDRERRFHWDSFNNKVSHKNECLHRRLQSPVHAAVTALYTCSSLLLQIPRIFESMSVWLS